MHVAAAHGQHLVAALEVDLRGLVVVPLDVADRAQVDDDRAVDLRELLRVELLEQLLERRPDQRPGRLPAVAPGDERVLRVRPQVPACRSMAPVVMSRVMIPTARPLSITRSSISVRGNIRTVPASVWRQSAW